MSDPAPSVPPSPENPAAAPPAAVGASAGLPTNAGSAPQSPQQLSGATPSTRANDPNDPFANAPPKSAGASWNPLQTPLAWIVVALQAGLYVLAVSRSDWRWNGPYDTTVVELGALDIWRGYTEPWRWVATLFLNGMIFNVLVCVMLLYSLAPALEKQIKTWRFGLLYALGGLGGELTREFLHRSWSDQIAIGAGNGGRCAAFALLGSIGGIYLALGAARQAIGFVAGRVGYYAVMLVLVTLLQRQVNRIGLGLDIWGVLSDMGVGLVCGLAVALTLHKDWRRSLGFVAVLVLIGAIGFEARWIRRLGRGTDEPETPADQRGSNGNGGGGGSRNNRKVDERASGEFKPTPTPSPITSLPDEDSPALAEIRARAHALLDPLGPVPGPQPDDETRQSARKLAAELVDFDNHWKENAAANLDLEMAQLYLVDHEPVSADRAATTARTMLGSPLPARGTPKARRLAQALATRGLASLEQGKKIEARRDFQEAAEDDPTLPEPHFYLGKLLPHGSDEGKLQLKAFLDLVGPSPPPSQAELVPEAKGLLGS